MIFPAGTLKRPIFKSSRIKTFEFTVIVRSVSVFLIQFLWQEHCDICLPITDLHSNWIGCFSLSRPRITGTQMNMKVLLNGPFNVCGIHNWCRSMVTDAVNSTVPYWSNRKALLPYLASIWVSLSKHEIPSVQPSRWGTEAEIKMCSAIQMFLKHKNL